MDMGENREKNRREGKNSTFIDVFDYEEEAGEHCLYTMMFPKYIKEDNCLVKSLKCQALHLRLAFTANHYWAEGVVDRLYCLLPLVLSYTCPSELLQCVIDLCYIQPSSPSLIHNPWPLPLLLSGLLWP